MHRVVLLVWFEPTPTAAFSVTVAQQITRHPFSPPREVRHSAKGMYVYQTAEKYLMSQLPVIPIAQYETHTLVSSRVKDLTMSAFGTFDASTVQLTK